MSFYYQVYQNPLRTILGLAGLTIDAVCNSESSKLFVRQVWKVHMGIVRKMESDRITADKKADEDFLKEWYQSLKDTEHFRENKPRGYMVSIREETGKFFK